MNDKHSRRTFLKQSAIAAGSLSLLPFPAIARSAKPGEKLNCVQIGCGGRAATHLEQVILNQKQNLVAVVDPDEKQHAWLKKWLSAKKISAPDLKFYTDYRTMFDKIGKRADAVFIAAPNHHHAPAAMLAMEAGLNVYCEKPLCHDVAEARMLSAAAAKHSKVATQMGNQGHCIGGYHRLCEYIWAGAIGNVTETHSWTNRANGGAGPRPPSLPVPAGMHWDSWIGPAPFRNFHSDLHPHEWHGWYDFGNGSIGNMGCHVLEGVFWALKAGHPTSVEMEMVRGGSDERYPLGSRIRWDLPEREGMPPLKAYWYEGMNATTKDEPKGSNHAAAGSARNFPPLMAKLMEQYPDEELDRSDSATLYVGDKGVIYTGTYGGEMHIVPREKMNEGPQPAKTLPRPNPNIFADFVKACQEGRTDTASPFSYGAKLTEFTILGNLAQHAGVENKVMWDGPNMKVTNIPELNRWLTRTPRSGWPA